jgi:hypothetical protein
MNQHEILCEIRKECKWHLCNALQSLWERSYQKKLFLCSINSSKELTCQNQKWRQCSSLSSISRVLFTFNSSHKAKQSTKLIMWKYWSSYLKLWVEKAWTLAQQPDFPPWRCSSWHGTLCQALSSSKIDYCNGTPILHPWSGSEWFLAVSKNKVCLNVKISEYWRHEKHDDGIESYFTTGVPKTFPTVTALLG